jgi:hypothetical protein
LRHSGGKNVQAATILAAAADPAKLFVQSFGVCASELRNTAHAEGMEVAHGRRADGNQVAQFAL